MKEKKKILDRNKRNNIKRTLAILGNDGSEISWEIFKELSVYLIKNSEENLK